MNININANEITTLKSKIKAEMLRRDGNGSIAAYGSAAYDFSEHPTCTPGTVISSELGEKTIDLLLKIQDYGDLYLTQKGYPIPDTFNKDLIGYVDTLAAEDVNGSTSSCRGMCTGLCVANCHETCNGCKNTCEGCNNTCQSSCNGCTNTCGSGCASGARN